ncbi:ABC transporter [Anaeromicropila herbilytica]|uniref:ABC transporter n=2 Tax=Anaeromicropila herbilytica TaxID=2785025 RepID=A0A7R7IAV3_9FIRM|nr:ABC transporter [Anaeromicropila herbilytica]
MDYSLEVKDLSKRYNTFALNNVSFNLKPGSIMGFIGENGAGKSTTIKSILNLIHRDHGEIKIFGLDNIKSEKEIRQNIGIVFDECRFHDTLYAKDVDLFLSKIYKNWDSKLYSHYLEQFKLPAKKYIKEFSRGMKMKLSIAAALSHNPQLLLLDEPTSGLDPIVRTEILDVFLEFIQDEKNSILMSSHITGDLEKIADYITFIHEGKIELSESKDDIIYSYGILKCKQSDFSQIDIKDIISYRKNSFGYEVLVTNKAKLSRKYPNYIIDSASLEDIMLFYSKGVQKC